MRIWNSCYTYKTSASGQCISNLKSVGTAYVRVYKNIFIQVW